jgi:DNA-binding MarR family transcriptional regulator
MKKYEELLISLRKVIRAIDIFSKKLNKDTGLTSPQLLVLQQIVLQEDVMVKDIAQRINLSSATVTSILDRLEPRGLVVRQRSTVDKRKVGLRVTPEGLAAINGAPTPLQEHFIKRFETLADWEQTQLVATMQRIASMMDAQDIDAAPLLDLDTLHNLSDK